MKKFNYLAIFGLLLTAALGFTSCSDDDDEGGALDTPHSRLLLQNMR